MHKYSIEVPTTDREAYIIYKKNVTDYWRKYIIKEMKNVSIEFDILEEGKWPSPMHIYLPFCIIFGVKMGFDRKYQYAVTGCHAPNSDEIRYAGVFSFGKHQSIV